MSRRKPSEYDPAARFQSVNAEARLTGFSRGFIITGCREGRIPHIKIGTDFRVDHPAWMSQLSSETICRSRERGA